MYKTFKELCYTPMEHPTEKEQEKDNIDTHAQDYATIRHLIKKTSNK